MKTIIYVTGETNFTSQVLSNQFRNAKVLDVVKDSLDVKDILLVSEKYLNKKEVEVLVFIETKRNSINLNRFRIVSEKLKCSFLSLESEDLSRFEKQQKDQMPNGNFIVV